MLLGAVRLDPLLPNSLPSGGAPKRPAGRCQSRCAPPMSSVPMPARGWKHALHLLSTLVHRCASREPPSWPDLGHGARVPSLCTPTLGSGLKLRTAIVPKTQALRRQCARSCFQCAPMQAWLVVHAMDRHTSVLAVPSRRHSHLERVTVDVRGGRRDKGPAPTHDRSRHTWSSPAGIRLWSSVQSIAAGQDRLHSLQSDDWAGETGDDVSRPDTVSRAQARRPRRALTPC